MDEFSIVLEGVSVERIAAGAARITFKDVTIVPFREIPLGKAFEELLQEQEIHGSDRDGFMDAVTEEYERQALMQLLVDRVVKNR